VVGGSVSRGRDHYFHAPSWSRGIFCGCRLPVGRLRAEKNGAVSALV